MRFFTPYFIRDKDYSRNKEQAIIPSYILLLKSKKSSILVALIYTKLKLHTQVEINYIERILEEKYHNRI